MISITLGFPDVCKVTLPIGIVPIPLPNFVFSILSIPNVVDHFIQAMPVHNLMTTTPISTGNEISAPLGGVVSNRFIGDKRNILGSFKTFYSCMPVTRMLDPAGQNGSVLNVPGINLSPSQIKVLILV